MPRPLSDLQQSHTAPKVNHPDLRREPAQAAWNEIHGGDRCQGSLPKHPSNIKIIPDDHNVHTLGALQVDPPAIWHILGIRRVATSNSHGP